MLVFISKFISIDKPNCHFERISHCHFERAKRVEKSKSCKYNKYPEPPSIKQPFLWTGKEKATANAVAYIKMLVFC